MTAGEASRGPTGREGLTAAMNRLFARTRRGEPRAEIAPGPRVGPLPLSFAQRRLWFLDQMMPGSPFYNFPMAVRVRGGLDVGVLARALSVVVSRHETLRTVFSAPGGVPCAVIRPAGEVPVEVVDVADEAAALVLAGQEAAAGFDLERGPVLRARVLRLGADEQVLLLTVRTTSRRTGGRTGCCGVSCRLRTGRCWRAGSRSCRCRCSTRISRCGSGSTCRARCWTGSWRTGAAGGRAGAAGAAAGPGAAAGGLAGGRCRAVAAFPLTWRGRPARWGRGRAPLFT